VRITPVAPEVVRPLRQKVLRPHQTIAKQVYAGDDAPGAAHFAAFDDDGRVVGIASITPEPYPRDHDGASGAFRIRGMATDPDAGRGLGAGAQLLTACLDHARDRGGRRVWCNARTPARGFYERAGFTAVGDEFTLTGIGPHFLMFNDLS
jgi:predicted GNAT family N-acyltransferase